MPDGFEYCYNSLLNPANSTDAYGDTDKDGLNNVEEFEVFIRGVLQISPIQKILIQIMMVCQMAGTNNGINPKDGSNYDDDPDFDGYDVDKDLEFDIRT